MSEKSLRVLFTSAGRRVELLQCFRRAGSELGLRLDVLACDLDATLSAACHVADKAYDVPRCTDPGYAAAVLDIARTNDVRLVIPTIDPELMALASATPSFAVIGTRVHVSPPAVVAVAQDKLKTAQVLSAAGVPVPATFELIEARLRPQDMAWPLFMKPKAGSASRGLKVINSAKELPDHVAEPMVLQELLEGPEYTVNVLIGQSGELKSAITHRRLQVRAGEVEKGRTVRRSDLRTFAERIVAALPGARGVLCFQAIDDRRGGPKVFEINARFGGGYPLADHAGARYAKWLLEEVIGEPSTAHDNWREGVTMLRYDSAVFKG